MAKCKQCGNKGLFLKLINGKCKDCTSKKERVNINQTTKYENSNIVITPIEKINPYTVYSEDSDYPSIEYYLTCELPIKDNELSYKEHPIHRQHLRYYIAIREIYKDRIYQKALKHTIELCEKDIEIVKKYGNNPAVGNLNYESFKRLIIIYEKQKEYKKAISLCETALNLIAINPTNPFNKYYGKYLKEKLNALKKKYY